MNRYELTEEIKEKYTPIVKKFIEEIESNSSDGDLLEKDFSDTELNPYTLGKIIECLGYKCEDRNDNGWELDFWIDYSKDGYKPIQIKGTGIIFEVFLAELED